MQTLKNGTKILNINENKLYIVFDLETHINKCSLKVYQNSSGTKIYDSPDNNIELI